MINGLSVLAIIPARGGSKGLPGKNIIDLGGKPLIAWTIDAAHRSKYIDRTILSSDDSHIIKVCRDLGCEIPFVRPAELASDTASSYGVVKHAVLQVPGFDLIVLLQPTSPLRGPADIDAALELLVQAQADNCISVCPARDHPYWMYTTDERNRLKRFAQDVQVPTRRQDLPPLYVPNGAIYVIRSQRFERSTSMVLDDAVAYEMSSESSVDIDDETDLLLASVLLGRRLPMLDDAKAHISNDLISEVRRYDEQ